MPAQCPKCNSLNSDAARFCSSCGFSLISSSENHSPSVIVVKQQPRSSSMPPAPPERIHQSVIETVEIPVRLLKRLKRPFPLGLGYACHCR
jgi:hypothetical protein